MGFIIGFLVNFFFYALGREVEERFGNGYFVGYILGAIGVLIGLIILSFL